MMMTEQMFHVYQLIDGEQHLLYSLCDEKRAQDEVDRINNHLSMRGIPSSVSCAYLK